MLSLLLLLLLLLLLSLLASFFFYPSLSDSKSPQVSGTLLRIFSQTQQRWSLDSFVSPTDFQFLQPFLQASGDCSKCTNNNWYYLDPHVPQSVHFSDKVFFYLFYFFIFSQWSKRTAKSTRWQVLVFKKRLKYWNSSSRFDGVCFNLILPVFSQ